ncbi:transposase [Nostocoides australiense]
MTRNHVHDDEKAAIVTQLRRLGTGTVAHRNHVRAVAARHDVTERTVRRWLAAADPEPKQCPPTEKGEPTAPKDQPAPVGQRFEITSQHLLALSQERTARAAHQRLREHGEVTVSYPTFARALERVDPARKEGALDGYKGMVNNRVYLQVRAPHRGHTLHVDHTTMDLRVMPDHRSTRPIRPYLTVCVDGYSSFAWAYAWKTPPNADTVASALAETAIARDYCGVTLGGIPEQVVFDNATENYASATGDGVARLGWVFSPIPPYSSWQNGKAERAIQAVNDRLSSRAPGALHAGTTREGQRRHTPNIPAKTDPATLWSWPAFLAALDEVVHELNTTMRMQRLGGRTRLEAYATDPTEQRFLSDLEVRAAMLRTAKGTYRVTKNGIQFDNQYFVAAEMQVGRSYQVRHLPRGRDFIEVFEEDGRHVARAHPADRMPTREKSRLLARRAAVEAEHKQIEAVTVDLRRRMAEIRNDEFGNDDEPLPASPVTSDASLTAPPHRKRIVQPAGPDPTGSLAPALASRYAIELDEEGKS